VTISGLHFPSQLLSGLHPRAGADITIVDATLQTSSAARIQTRC